MPKKNAEKTALDIKNYIERKLSEDAFCKYKLKCKIGETFGVLKDL